VARPRLDSLSLCALRSRRFVAPGGDRKEAEATETLDSALKERLRAVLDRQPVTESELRRLAEEGRACTLILGAQLARSERRLAEVTGDPSSPLADIAAAFREVNVLRPDLEELEELLGELERRAREFRASWLSMSGRADSGSP
jgi:hypothetical protein